MQLSFSLTTRAAYWANLAVRMSIDIKERYDWGFHYLQVADTVKYILYDICISIIENQCSDHGEYQRKW